jgi:hypothetical protein
MCQGRYSTFDVRIRAVEAVERGLVPFDLDNFRILTHYAQVTSGSHVKPVKNGTKRPNETAWCDQRRRYLQLGLRLVPSRWAGANAALISCSRLATVPRAMGASKTASLISSTPRLLTP